MSGNPRVPGSPQNRMRESARPGTWRGLLERNARETADIRMGEMRGAKGRAYRRVRNPGGGPDYVVADQTGGRTFAPGTGVMLGKPYDSKHEAVLGGPPVGKKGPARPRRPGRRPGQVVANQYAFWRDEDTGNVHAWLYNDAEFVVARGVQESASFYTYNENGTLASCILSDSSGLVGDGSLVASGATSDVYVWDVEGNVVHSYSTPAGWRQGMARYQAGFLWWVESTDTSGGTTVTYQIRLVKATTDLSTVTVVSTWSSPTVTLPVHHDELVGGEGFPNPVEHRELALGPSAGFVMARWKPSNASSRQSHLRFPLDGGAITEHALTNGIDAQGVDTPPSFIPLAGGFGANGDGVASSGGALIPYWHDYNMTGTNLFGPLMRQSDSVSTEPENFWPTTFAADCQIPLDLPVSTGTHMLWWNINAIGSLFQMSFTALAGGLAYLRDSAASAPGGTTPATAFIVTAHPDFPSGTDVALFFFGES